jgi:hypothetical protein
MLVLCSFNRSPITHGLKDYLKICLINLGTLITELWIGHRSINIDKKINDFDGHLNYGKFGYINYISILYKYLKINFLIINLMHFTLLLLPFCIINAVESSYQIVGTHAETIRKSSAWPFVCLLY